MKEHLERALIEVYFAMAEFNREQALLQAVEALDPIRETLIMARFGLEEAIRLHDETVPQPAQAGANSFINHVKRLD